MNKNKTITISLDKINFEAKKELDRIRGFCCKQQRGNPTKLPYVLIYKLLQFLLFFFFHEQSAKANSRTLVFLFIFF